MGSKQKLWIGVFLVLVIAIAGIAVATINSNDKAPVSSNTEQPGSNGTNPNSNGQNQGTGDNQQVSDQNPSNEADNPQEPSSSGSQTSTTGQSPRGAAVTSISLDKTALDMVNGEVVHLTAIVSPARATNKKLTWNSGDSTIATVDANGAVTGVKAGVTTITAKAQDGSQKSASVQVTVYELRSLNAVLGEQAAITSTDAPVKLSGQVEIEDSSLNFALSFPKIPSGSAITLKALDPALVPEDKSIPFSGLDISLQGIADLAKVELPLPAGLSADQAGAFHYADGVWQFRPATSENGKVRFTTNLSPVAVSQKVGVPAGLSAAYTQNTNTVTLNWKAVSGSNITYRLYKDGKALAATAETSYADFDPTNGKHSYSVRAYRGLFESGLSAEAIITVVRPQVAAINISGQAEIIVPVSGSTTTPAFTAALKDSKGLELPWETVKWSLEQATAGVSVNTASGEITVQNTASADAFTLVATSESNDAVTASKQIALRRLSSVSISGGAAYIVIPANGSTTVSTFAASVKDQKGAGIDGEKVVWSLQTPTDGVSVDPDTGSITVENSAAAGKITLVAASASKPGLSYSQEVPLRMISSVSISGGVPTILVPGSGSITVSTFAASVKDQEGKGIDGEQVIWSLQTPSGGVSVDTATGAVTVGSTATADKITLVATSQSKPSLSWSQEISLLRISSVSISGGASTVIVPTSGSTTTPSFSAVVRDQYGRAIDGEKVIWSLQTPADGVGIDPATGAITINSSASVNTIALVATSQSNHAVNHTQEVLLRRLSSISISGGVSSILVPVSGSTLAPAFSAVVVDQYGQALSGEKVIWSLEVPVNGVSVNSATGVVTVAGNSTADGVTLVATSQSKPGVSASKAITLRRISSISISGGAASILIPESGVTTTPGFTAAVNDQMGRPIEGQDVTWSLQAEISGVSVDADTGAITVANTAAADKIVLAATSQTNVKVSGTLEIVLNTLQDSSFDKANSVATDGTAQTHGVYPATDEDWFKFEAQQGAVYTIRTSNLHSTTPDGNEMDTYIYLYDQDGSTLLAKNDDVLSGDTYDSRIDWVAPAAGTYYVRVIHYEYRHGDTSATGTGIYDIYVQQGDQAFAAAVSAVEKAEADDNAQLDREVVWQDYLTAKGLVTALPDGEGKSELQARLADVTWNYDPDPATGASFTDTDTHSTELGGTISWALPASEVWLEGYEVYFVDSDNYTIGEAIGQVAPGTSSFDIPAGTKIPSTASKLAVFSYNSENQGEPALFTYTDDWSSDHGPSELVAQDNDTAQSGVDGRDFTLNWTPAVWPSAAKQKIFIFQGDVTELSAIINGAIPVATIDDNTTTTWTGDNSITADSSGNPLVGGTLYTVYVVAYDSSEGWLWRSNNAQITPIVEP